MKLCVKCGIIQPLAQYSRDKHSRDGKQKRCKSCWHNFHPQKRREVTLATTMVKYSWSKYDAPKKPRFDLNSSWWYCQVCHTELPRGIDTFSFEYPLTEFIKICPLCSWKKRIYGIKPGEFTRFILFITSV